MLRNEVWRCVPERGELFPIDWQHNVGRGALVTTVNGCDGEVTPVREIAVSAAAALNIDFATVDVVKRSEEHTSELQSLMRISYAVFCLKNKIYRHYSILPHTRLNYQPQIYDRH